MPDRNEMFSAGDFVKREMTIDDVFVLSDFQKPTFEVAKIALTWATKDEKPDLDLAAIMLDAKGYLNVKSDLVYFASTRRWRTNEPIGSENFNALDGRVSLYEKDSMDFKNETEWLVETLPLSDDDSVIGSWDDRGNSEEGLSEERLHIKFKEIDARRYSSIAIIAAISMEDVKDGWAFKDVYNPILSVKDADDDRVLAEYKLNQDFSNYDGVCVGYLQYNETAKSWEFKAAGKGYSGGMLKIANSFVRRR